MGVHVKWAGHAVVDADRYPQADGEHPRIVVTVNGHGVELGLTALVQ